MTFIFMNKKLRHKEVKIMDQQVTQVESSRTRIQTQICLFMKPGILAKHLLFQNQECEFFIMCGRCGS